LKHPSFAFHSSFLRSCDFIGSLQPQHYHRFGGLSNEIGRQFSSV
jgi:hypothetical protein